jgi:hypothetical protein
MLKHVMADYRKHVKTYYGIDLNLHRDHHGLIGFYLSEKPYKHTGIKIWHRTLVTRVIY